MPGGDEEIGDIMERRVLGLQRMRARGGGVEARCEGTVKTVEEGDDEDERMVLERVFEEARDHLRGAEASSSDERWAG